ncbi:MAG: hypothetical protein ACI835_005779, partial [Planctomycetota bacterium]
MLVRRYMGKIRACPFADIYIRGNSAANPHQVTIKFTLKRRNSCAQCLLRSSKEDEKWRRFVEVPTALIVVLTQCHREQELLVEHQMQETAKLKQHRRPVPSM